MTSKEKDRLRKVAKSCKTRTEFAHKHGADCRKVLRHGLADELFSHMPKPRRWSLSELRELAKKFDTRDAWLRSSPSSYQALHRKGRDIVDLIAPPSRKRRKSA